MVTVSVDVSPVPIVEGVNVFVADVPVTFTSSVCRAASLHVNVVRRLLSEGDGGGAGEAGDGAGGEDDQEGEERQLEETFPRHGARMIGRFRNEGVRKEIGESLSPECELPCAPARV